MSTVDVTQNNFNGGELSPSLWGSFDLEKYQTCIKKGQNAIISETREIMNRPGLEFVAEVSDGTKPVRLLPFKFNSEQSCIIEAGENYFRFIQDGGLIKYPSNYGNTKYSGSCTLIGTIGSTAQKLADNFNPIRYDENVQQVGRYWFFTGRFEGDVAFKEEFAVAPDSVSCYIMGEPATVTQISTEGFHYNLAFGAKLIWQINNPEAVYYAENLKDNIKIYKYSLTNNSVIYTGEPIAQGVMTYSDINLLNPYGLVNSLADDVVSIGYDAAKQKVQNEIVKLAVPYAASDLEKLKFAQNSDVVTFTCGAYPPKELTRYGNYEWYLKDVITKADITTPSGLEATWSGGNDNPRTYKYKVTAINSNGEESPASVTCSVVGEYEASWGIGEKITLSWDKVVGAEQYNIYRNVNGIYGFVGASDINSFVDEKIEPDMSATPPIQQNPFEETQNGYPACVTYYQQRRIFADFPNFPQRFIASQVGTNSNFNTSKPTVASDAMTVDLSSNEMNEIKHLVALEDLIVLTTGAEWRVKGSDGSFSATPAPLCNPQTYWGCSDIPPIVSGNMILFVTETRNCIRDLGYTYLSDSYDGDDLTIFARHLFENNRLKEWAYVKTPTPLIIGIMTDGTAIASVYNKKQNICGYTTFKTDGKFESVAVIKENGNDVAYFVVKRTINGTDKRYIERMKFERTFEKTEDAFFVDCGLTKNFDNEVFSITGLNHLEGKTVVALCDGGVQENLTVTDGSITLKNPAKKITVGLPYSFRLELLPVDTQGTVGHLKKLTEVSAKIRNSREDFFVQTGKTRKQLPRTVSNIKDGNVLKTGSVKTQIFGEGVTETELVIEQSYPLPLCISSITQKITVG